MHERPSKYLKFALGGVTALIVLAVGGAMAQTNGLSIAGYDLVSKKRVDRTTFEYEYAVDVANGTDSDVENVSVTVSSTSPNVTVVDGTADVGSIASGTTATSGDTIAVEVDRRNRFDPNALQSTISAASSAVEEIIPTTGGTIGVGNFADITFADGAFSSSTLVKAELTNLDDYRQAFDETTYIFGVAETFGTVLKLDVEFEQPNEPVTIEITLPQAFVSTIQGNQVILIFAARTSSSNLELPYPYFELLDAVFDSQTDVLKFEAVAADFTRIGNTQSNLSGMFVVGLSRL